MYGYDPPIMQMGQKCCPVMLFFLKIMPFESNTALGYDITWHNALTIFKYSLMLNVAKGLKLDLNLTKK